MEGMSGMDPSNLDPHQKLKHRRIEDMAKVLETRGRVDFKKFLAEMQYDGIRKSVAEEYLETLKDLGKIAITEEQIVWNTPNKDTEEKPNNTFREQVKNNPRENVTGISLSS